MQALTCDRVRACRERQQRRAGGQAARITGEEGRAREPCGRAVHQGPSAKVSALSLLLRRMRRLSVLVILRACPLLNLACFFVPGCQICKAAVGASANIASIAEVARLAIACSVPSLPPRCCHSCSSVGL